jgi:hypothetical protein
VERVDYAYERERKVMYDINNNCVNCDQYRYDQHRNNCAYYVKESYLQFIKRISEGK